MITVSLPPLPPLRYSGLIPTPGRVRDFLPALFVPLNRSIGGITADITIEEQERDELTITEHPVEQGAPIADHAFKRPSEVTIRAGWTAQKHNLNSVWGTYNTLLSWQAALNPFQLFTGKRVYNDMLISSIAVTTDQSTEFVLMATITCRQIIRVSTHVVEAQGVSGTENGDKETQSPKQSGTKSATSAKPSSGTAKVVEQHYDEVTIETGMQMAVFEIPLESFDEVFQIGIEGITYGIRMLWNTPAQCWMMDIYDEFDVPILTGTPLVTGADLLAQYHYLHIGGDIQFGAPVGTVGLIVITTAIGRSPDEIPSETNLGAEGKLFYVTP